LGRAQVRQDWRRGEERKENGFAIAQVNINKILIYISESIQIHK
jgi:hypothetical protein